MLSAATARIAREYEDIEALLDGERRSYIAIVHVGPLDASQRHRFLVALKEIKEKHRLPDGHSATVKAGPSTSATVIVSASIEAASAEGAAQLALGVVRRAMVEGGVRANDVYLQVREVA